MNEQNNDPFVIPGISVDPDDENGAAREDDGIRSFDLSNGSQIAISLGETDEPAALPSVNAGISNTDDPMQGTIAQSNRLRNQANQAAPFAGSVPQSKPAGSAQRLAPVNGEPPSPQRKKCSAGSAVAWCLTFLLLVMAVLVFYLIAR